MFSKTIFKRISDARGFTLMELLMTLAILAIVVTLAIPSGVSFFAKNNTLAQVTGLTHALSYARSEAISRNEKLIFCPSSDKESCGGKWRDGQILIDTQGKVLRVFSIGLRKDDLVWNSSGGIDNSITWMPTGYTQGQRGTFYYCVKNNTADSRSVVLLDTGRVYVSAMDASDYNTHCFTAVPAEKRG